MTRHLTGQPGGWPIDLSRYDLGDVIEDARGITQTVVQVTYDGCGHTGRMLWLGQPASVCQNSRQIGCRQCGHPGANHASVPAVADVLGMMRQRECSQDEAVRLLDGQP